MILLLTYLFFCSQPLTSEARWLVVINGSATKLLASVAFQRFLCHSGEAGQTERERNFMCSFWQQENKWNGWGCLNLEPEGPKGEQEGGSKKELMSVCCMTEVVLPAILEQETRCVLGRKVNICGVLAFRRDKNWDFINLVKESGCFDVEVVLVCSRTDVFGSFQNQL